ncbi:hypothetical protein L3Y34_017530 [Caenorhabditis briggsae]|uniref:Uncharacterized protein n=1 Tax=Caenorhabditis briggsae TaxID=6238 RepID=A0AAE9DI15_CAEBR|nr:hypothetical protein L3Y34_017530 [Caenorhabditis briggsae]
MTFLPTSADFFLSKNLSISSGETSGGVKKNLEVSNGRPVTYLAGKSIFKFLDLKTRQRLHSRCTELRVVDRHSPLTLHTCSIGSNSIEFDFFGSSWTFENGEDVTIRCLGGLVNPQKKLKMSQNDAMKEILKFYLNRRGTTIKKLFIQDKKVLNILETVGVFKNFEIQSGLDVMRFKDHEMEIKELPDAILRNIQWRLEDRRRQY